MDLRQHISDLMAESVAATRANREVCALCGGSLHGHLVVYPGEAGPDYAHLACYRAKFGCGTSRWVKMLGMIPTAALKKPK